MTATYTKQKSESKTKQKTLAYKLWGSQFFYCSSLPLTGLYRTAYQHRRKNRQNFSPSAVNTDVPTPWEWSSSYTLTCTNVAEYCIFVIKEFFNIGVLLYHSPLQSWQNLIDGLCSLQWQIGTARNSGSSRFSEHHCALSEMALFHCALHSENTHITQARFYWVFVGTKYFNTITIFSSLVRHFNWAQVHEWSSHFPWVAENRGIHMMSWYKWAKQCLLVGFYQWIHSAIFNNPSGYALGIIEYCFVYSW